MQSVNPIPNTGAKFGSAAARALNTDDLSLLAAWHYELDFFFLHNEKIALLIIQGDLEQGVLDGARQEAGRDPEYAQFLRDQVCTWCSAALLGKINISTHNKKEGMAQHEALVAEFAEKNAAGREDFLEIMQYAGLAGRAVTTFRRLRRLRSKREAAFFSNHLAHCFWFTGVHLKDNPELLGKLFEDDGPDTGRLMDWLKGATDVFWDQCRCRWFRQNT